MEKLIIKVQNSEEEDKIFEFVDVDNAGGVVYNYKGKPFSGIIQHCNGDKIVYEEEFTNGHVGGVQREYYENGQMKDEVTIRYAKPEGDWRGWDEQGNLLYHSVWEEGEMIKEIIPRKA